MAQVPTNEQTVFPEQGPLPQANGADFGGQVGQAQQGLGEQLGQAGDVMAKHVLAWQGLKNEATAQDLNVSFQSDLGKLETQYYGLKGKQQADAYPAFETQVQALRQQYLGRAGNPMVANMLGGTLGQSVGYTLRSAGRQAGAATKDWMIQSAAGHADMLTYQAQQHYNDPTYVATAREGIKASIQNYGELQGWSQDTIDLKVIEQNNLLDKGIQDAAKGTLNGLPVTDALAALVGGTAAPGKPGEVGGQAYKLALVRTEFGSGKDTPGNTHKGPVQADDAWLQHFGSGKPRDQMTLQDWMDATDKETAENTPKLEKALGRKVTDADLYLAHQQGEAGAEALLKNPDRPAKDVIDPANLEANIPKHPDGSPIMDPNTITAGQFAAIWSKGFISQSGIAGQPSMASQQAQEAAAALDPQNRQEMAKTLLSAINSQDAAVRAQTNFEQEQKAKADKQQYDGTMTTVKAAIEANWADPTHAPAVDLSQLAQTPFFKQHPEALTEALNYRKNLDNKPDGGDGETQQLYRGWLNGTATTADFQEAFAPKDGTPGKISKANLDFLMSAAKGSGDDPQSQSVKELKAKFLSTAEQGIKGAPVEGTDGDSATYRFDFDFQQAWDAKVKAGEDPKGLITPGSKDYFGSLANLSHYSQTAADALQAQVDAQNPGLLSRLWTSLTGGESGPTIPADLPVGTTLYDRKTKDGRNVYRLPDGSLKAEGAPAATPAPAPAPVAAAGPPDVPSGE